MSELTIDKNITLPTVDSTSWKGILELMDVGDSVSIDRAKRASISSIISNEYHGLTKKRFRISVKNQPKGKARIWRIEDAIEE